MQSLFLPRRYAPSKAPIAGFIGAGTLLDTSPFSWKRRLPIPLPYRRFGMFAFQVAGNSMTLADGTGLTEGTWVLVDTHDILSSNGQVYAFRLPDGSMVAKRLGLHRGRPAMHSDNDDHPPQHLHSGIRTCGRIYAFSPDGVMWQPTRYRAWS